MKARHFLHAGLVALFGASLAFTTAQAASSTGAGSQASLFHLLPEHIQKSGQIVIGSAINYPPFEYYAPDGRTPIGFEVDLATQLEKVLGIKFKWENASFDSLFASMKAGRYDVVYGATNDTPEREKRFDMVDYLQASQAFVVRKGNPENITKITDLCGKKIAAVRGGVQPQWINGKGSEICKEHGKPIMTALTFSGAAGEQLAVREGKAVALLENFPTAVVFARESKGTLEVVPDIHVLKTYFSMVVPKDKPKLRDALQQGWNAIIKNGTYGEVLAKWGVASAGLTESYINGATTHPPK